MNQYVYNTLIPDFIAFMFNEGDSLRIAVNTDTFQNYLLKRDLAIDYLLKHENTPNLYFAPSSFANTGNYTSNDCLATSVFCIDLDYGSVGHKKTSLFSTLDDAYAYVMTIPFIPHCVWHTGHGLQCLFKLKERINLKLINNNNYRVSKKLGQLCLSDATFTPEHLFRVPLTINAKPNCEFVKGEVLYWHPYQKPHIFDNITVVCKHYGIERTKYIISDNEDIIPYDQLPRDIRNDIESRHTDRSVAMFSVIMNMKRQGIGNATIIDAVMRGHDFKAKYGNRLLGEINRILKDKSHILIDAPILDKINANNIHLSSCGKLSVPMRKMLAKYAKLTGITNQSNILKTALFCEHVFNKPQGIIETPCGCGKSTWALCHMAVNASKSHRYIYVTETLDALYNAAELLEKLNPKVNVGRYHGFNKDICFKLCGVKHNWRECSLDVKSVCHKCTVNKQCHYFNREREFKKNIVVMAHQALIILLELQPGKLNEFNVIVDEDINAFLNENITVEELKLAYWYMQCANTDSMTLNDLFPGNRMTKPYGVKLNPTSPTYAARNFVFVNNPKSNPSIEIKKALAVDIRLSSLLPTQRRNHTAQDIRHSQETLGRLNNFFRVGQDYAFREIIDNVPGYALKKSRISFDQLPFKKFWILNASALISINPYPDNMDVYHCANLKANSKDVTLYVIKGNPTRTNVDAKHINAGIEIIKNNRNKHKNILLASGKNQDVSVLELAIQNHMPVKSMVKLTRGRLKGTNAAGECTLAFMASLSLFTTLDDCALSAALSLQRTFPISEVFNANGIPHMPGGRFKVPEMRKYYALRSLDEMYQAIYRTAIRNNKPVEAIVVIPDVEWLSILERTVMPGFKLGGAFSIDNNGQLVPAADMAGFIELVRYPAGRIIPKKRIAEMMGVKSWKESKDRLWLLLAPFYEDQNAHNMKRK